jgi:hypothetical protein
MRVDVELQIARERRHLHGQPALGDQIARARADDAHNKHPLGCRVDDELRQARRPIDRDRAAKRGPRELRDLDLAPLLLDLGLGEAAPGDLRIGEHDGWNRPRLEHRVLAEGGPCLGMPVIGYLQRI